MYDLETIRRLNEEATGAGGVDEVREYVAGAINGFVNDNPDSPFQRGYLAALCAVAKEALHEDMQAQPYVAGEAILNGWPVVGPCSAWPRKEAA